MIKRVSGEMRRESIGMLMVVLAMGIFLAVGESAHAAGRDGIPTTPTGGFYYQLSVEGIVNGYFAEAYNMGSETEVVTHKAVGPQGKVMLNKIPGNTKFFDVTLRRGITANLDLVNWRKLVLEGNTKSARKNAVITMFDGRSTIVASWNLASAWPSKHIFNPMEDVSATNTPNINAIESITITFDEIERVK